MSSKTSEMPDWTRRTLDVVLSLGAFGKAENSNGLLQKIATGLCTHAECQTVFILKRVDRIAFQVVASTPNQWIGSETYAPHYAACLTKNEICLYPQWNHADELVGSVASAAFFPLTHPGFTGLVVLAWSVPQSFTDGLKKFLEDCKQILQESVCLSASVYSQ